MDWLRIGNGVHQGGILSPCLFNLYAEYIMRNEAQAGIKIAGRNINNLSMQITPPLWQKQRETKKSLDENERGEREIWLKAQHSKNEDHGIWSHHFMLNRWGNNGNSDRLYFLGSKITADGDCSHEIQRRLLLGRKAMTNLDSILKSRDITLPTKVHLVKLWFFQSSWMDMRVGPLKKLSTKELMFLNCGVGLQDQTSQS